MKKEIIGPSDSGPRGAERRMEDSIREILRSHVAEAGYADYRHLIANEDKSIAAILSLVKGEREKQDTAKGDESHLGGAHALSPGKPNHSMDEIAEILTRLVGSARIGNTEHNNVRKEYDQALAAIREKIIELLPEKVSPETIQLFPPGDSRDYERYCMGFNNCLDEITKRLEGKHE